MASIAERRQDTLKLARQILAVWALNPEAVTQLTITADGGITATVGVVPADHTHPANYFRD